MRFREISKTGACCVLALGLSINAAVHSAEVALNDVQKTQNSTQMQKRGEKARSASSSFFQSASADTLNNTRAISGGSVAKDETITVLAWVMGTLLLSFLTLSRERSSNSSNAKG